MSKKDTPLWREAHFEVKLCKAPHVRSTFGSRKSARRCEHISMSVKNRRSRTTWTFRCRFVWQAQGIFAPCQKWAKREGFFAVSTALPGVGLSKRICKNAFSVAGAVQETCSTEMLEGQGWFPERGYILVHQTVRFAKMILRDRCSTSYDLASRFCGRRNL